MDKKNFFAQMFTPGTVPCALFGMALGLLFAVLCLTVGVGKALLIGGFQVLSLIPGTSRSGATILGGLVAGLSQQSAAEFSFFLAIPTMLGASALKLAKFFSEGNALCTEEIWMLLAGTLTAFLVSLLTIRTLLRFVRRHSFMPFGVYRIALGALVLLSLFFWL